MKKYYLAIDIGASSGRHILGHVENGKMILEEIHRFPNGNVEKDGEVIWDIDNLFREILIGMKKCKDADKIPVSVGIDTWAVDLVLLDENDNRIGNAVGYRDCGTKYMDSKVYEHIREEVLYARTGIQKQIFNTIYQLMAWKEHKPELFKRAKTMLMIPDYLHFLLTDVKATEYTNATTTQLISPITKDWDFDLINILNYPISLFQKIVLPGTCLGNLTEKIQQEVGFGCKVVVPATHDTGSAVMAVPVREENASENILYISSGTWSLMGTELLEANCSPESKAKNFTNEGGYDYRFRYLKNIMGLWMIQSVKKEIGENYSFAEICEMASKTSISSIVDVNDDRFLAPVNMTEEIKRACIETAQPEPKNLAEVATVIYNSLAKCYGKTITEIEDITGKCFECVHIVGGGANAEYLNKLTAMETGKTVYAGPTEATAIGNIMAQMIRDGVFKELKEARTCVFKSFDVKEYKPEGAV